MTELTDHGTAVAAPTKGRILVVDDELVVRRVLARSLELDGYEVETIESVADAIRIAGENAPDLVLSDVRMPDASGIDLCRRLPGACGWEVPVILLSGLGARDDILAGFDAGARDYILKPWREDELLAKVRLHCRPRPTPRPSKSKLPLPDVGRGRFRLERQIGVGGMGSVFQGTDQRLDRPVAVKVLRPDLAEDENFVLRFLHEARILSRLDLPGIPRVHDAGREGEFYYYVMDLVEGETLRRSVEVLGPVAPEELARIGHGIAQVLEALESEGVVHRDIKPDNVLLTPEGEVSLVDFGLARTTNEPRFTAAHSVVGTVGYLPPEQFLTDDAPDIRGDLYGLGMTLWFAATGQDPEAGAVGGFDPINAHAMDLSDIRPDVATTFRTLVASLTAPAPDDRPRTARRARIELGRLHDGRRGGPRAEGC